MSEHDLDAIYREAQQALKSRDYVRASELLRQILVIDENYKDVSRLLAQTVKLKRRRWYNDPRLWGALGFVVIVTLGFFIAPRLKGMYSVQPSVTVAATNNLTATPPPTINPTATQTLLPTPTPIPLTWKRINIGQEFERDAVTAFATDKKDVDVIYAAMKNAGVYKTIDGGLSWRPAHNGLMSTQVESLLIDSQNPRILYAGTMGGVFKTEDGGESWRRLGDGAYLLMDKQNESHLYARDEMGIYETTDQGKNWIATYALNKDCPGTIRSWAIHPADGKTLFIGGGEECKPGIYQSTDSGRSWILIGMEGKPHIDPLAIGLDEQGNYSIYAQHVSPLGTNFHGVYTSHDGGSNWAKSGGNFGCGILETDPDNSAAIYCTGTSPNNLYVTKGRGDPWKALPGTYSKIYTATHIDHPNGTNRIIAGANDVSTTSDPNIGIFISEDGGISWTQRDSGLGSTQTELKTDPLDNTRIYLATYFANVESKCRLYRSLDKGQSWSLIKWRGGDWCGPTFDAAHVIYMKEAGALQKSFNGGETWLWDQQGPASSDIANRLPEWDHGVVFQSISANPYSDGLVYVAGNTIYYSTDAGHSWQLSASNVSSWDARLFYTDQGKMIYAIGRYHQSYSTDNGKTWQACGENVTTSRSDSRLALDLRGERLYLATPGQGVMISTDKCGSWQPSNNGLTNLFVNTLAIDPNDSNKIYAGTDGGAYVSFDSGQTWGQVNDGLLGATVVYSIVVDKDSNVYAATPYGIFKLEGK
jgi:photosystem II stability/assembly factor-like uncharacterized protein